MKRGAPAIGLALAAVFLASKVYGRYWPHELSGLWGELAALVVATGVAAAARAVARRHAAWAGPAILFTAYLALSAADPRLSLHHVSVFGPAGYLHAPEGCPFSVRFPQRPNIRTAATPLSDGKPAVSSVAEGTDVGAATAFRAECLAYAPADGAARQVLLRWAIDHLATWAKQPDAAGRAEIMGDEARLTLVNGSRDTQGRALPATIEARIAVGTGGVMILIASRLGENAVPARRFLDSLAAR